MVIHKFPLPLHLGGLHMLPLHPEARVIAVHPQAGCPTIWVLIPDPDPELTKLREFQIIGTGQDIPEGATYCGTSFHEFFVWHVFEVPTGG